VYRHILIPTDGSEVAHKAVTEGLALAKVLGAKITALTVEASFNVVENAHQRLLTSEDLSMRPKY
jgi:nucleotide-binding universal stress UspA family protein